MKKSMEEFGVLADVPSDAPFEESPATVAAVDPVVLAARFVAAHAAEHLRLPRHRHRRRRRRRWPVLCQLRRHARPDGQFNQSLPKYNQHM